MKGINMRVMKLNEVINTTGLSRSSIYAYMSKGNFPKPIQLGPRAVAWIEEEVQNGYVIRSAREGKIYQLFGCTTSCFTIRRYTVGRDTPNTLATEDTFQRCC